MFSNEFNKTMLIVEKKIAFIKKKKAKECVLCMWNTKTLIRFESF